jgi:hypothetical protein
VDGFSLNLYDIKRNAVILCLGVYFALEKPLGISFSFSVAAAELGGVPRLRLQRRRPRQPGPRLYSVLLRERVLRVQCELRGGVVAVGHNGVHAEDGDGVDAGSVRRMHVRGVRQPRRDAVGPAL